MIKVRATAASKTLNMKIKEFHRIVELGEEFEVTPERYRILSGDNRYGAKFVEAVESNSEAKDYYISDENITPELDQAVEVYKVEGTEVTKLDENLEPIKEEPKTKKSTPRKTTKK